GFEFFGGTVNTKYLVAAYCQDDAFDYDNGFRGFGQFWFAIQNTDTGGYAGEHDGGTSNDDDTPYAIPTILNATYIGSGLNSSVENADSKAFLIRDGAGGKYRNSIFAEFPSGGIEIEDKGVGSSKDRLDNGDLEFTNNLWWNVGGSENTINEIAPDASQNQQFVRDYLSNQDNNNFIQNPALNGIERLPSTIAEINGDLDPRVELSGPAYTNPIYSYDEDENEAEFNFFSEAPYYGAFGSGSLWIKGWTFLDEIGIVSDVTSVNIKETKNNKIISSYPNPAISNATIQFEVTEPTPVVITVSNTSGELVSEIENSFHNKGYYSTEINVDNYAAGVYIINLQTNNGIYNSILIVK
ncbi:T9SS type A sorting domain-containing protein, partial [Candidatus Kapabacteria bacterium]|nr:T9SS type A sorting domain-containing protein [Candidatus Kapabacteria bacterium]